MLGQNLLDLSPSLSGKVFTCWDRTPLIDMLCRIKTAPARVVLCNSRSTTMRPCSCSFLTMAASVRHNLKLGISEFRCVASPAPARAFVPARGSQVFFKFFESFVDWVSGYLGFSRGNYKRHWFEGRESCRSLCMFVCMSVPMYACHVCWYGQVCAVHGPGVWQYCM